MPSGKCKVCGNGVNSKLHKESCKKEVVVEIKPVEVSVISNENKSC